MDGSRHEPLRLTGKLHGLAQSGLQYARARLELLQHEISEEKARVGELLLRGALFAFAALTTYQLITAFIIVIFWDTAWRLHAIGVMVLISAGLAWWSWTAMMRSAKAGTEPLAATLREFDKDRDALTRLATDDPPIPDANGGTQQTPESGDAQAANTPRENPYASKHPVGA